MYPGTYLGGYSVDGSLTDEPDLIYLGDDAEALDGFEFLTMAEAGEVGHWSVLGKLNERARREDIQELVDRALPISGLSLAFGMWYGLPAVA